jgi:hypothetical protein
MASYNLQKPADRARYRADHQAELDAALDGSWPRNLNDQMRWANLPHCPYDGSEATLRKHREYVAKQCRAEIAYIDDLERRVVSGVAPLGFERA